MAKTGIIKDTFPPGNSGSQHGAGRVTEDVTGQDYVFQTPDDVTPGLVLTPGVKVAFEVSGNQATSLADPATAGFR